MNLEDSLRERIAHQMKGQPEELLRAEFTTFFYWYGVATFTMHVLELQVRVMNFEKGSGPGCSSTTANERKPRPLGIAVQELIAKQYITADLGQRLLNLVARRNELIHNLLPTVMPDLFRPGGRTPPLARCREVVKDARELSDELGPLVLAKIGSLEEAEGDLAAALDELGLGESSRP